MNNYSHRRCALHSVLLHSEGNRAPLGIWMIITLLCLPVGCDSNPATEIIRRPRPVTTVKLAESPPPSQSLVTASVGSWKTEPIGFEVGGRIEFVVEENTPIEGRVFAAQGQELIEGTPVARVESERFELQVARASAEVSRASQNLLVAETELNESIPAQIAAAVASRTLAQQDFDRSQKLNARNAGSEGELDRSRADLDSAIANVKQLEATEKAKRAEIKSLESAVEQAKQNLRDAERDLEDCTLYASFRGQVAEVDVVPGSVVSAGEPVVTLQMMNPIKVELEVSAEASRRLRRTEVYPVHVGMPDGSVEVHEGFLNQIDALADPLMRTYTLTFLVINKKLSMPVEPGVATAREIWRLDLPFLPGAKQGRLFIEEKSILEDEQGHFLWQASDVKVGSPSPENGRYEVRKIRVTPKPLKLPYLGNWVFQEVVVDDESFEPNVNLVIGELFVADGDPSKWQGASVQVDSGNRWMLRPGALVKVDLSKLGKPNGYFIPISAISRDETGASIFVAETEGDQTIAKRIAVQVASQDQVQTMSSRIRVEPAGDDDLEGKRLIVQGSHYLVDGEPISVVAGREVSQ